METNPKNIIYPQVDIDNPFMARAREVARLSNDQQQPTGAVIVCDGKTVAEASNKSPLDAPWLIRLHRAYCIRHLLRIPSGKKYWLCPGCASEESHAESRAVKLLLKKGIPDYSLDLYLYGHWWCCKVCIENMKKIAIRNVYLLEGCKDFFDLKSPSNILGKQFKK